MSERLRGSVVIPCLNEEENLPRVLDRVLDQDLPREEYEILVVDGGSTDRSVEIARSKGVRVIQSPRGVSVQRNRGAAEARAENLVFLDGDCLVGRDWLRRGLEHLERGAGLAGGAIDSSNSPSWVGRAWDFHNAVRRRALADRPAELFRLVTTANLFVRRDVFRRVGGFDESLGSGEDYLFCHGVRQLGEDIVFDDGLVVDHVGQPATLGAFFREQVWHSNREVWRRLRSSGQATAGQSAYRYGLLSAGLLVGVVAGAGGSLVFRTPWPAVGAMAAWIGLPGALSLRTCLRGRRFGPFVPLSVLYFVYGLARALYLLGIVRLGYRRK